VSCGGPLKVVRQVASGRVAWVPGHFVYETLQRDACACPQCPGEGVLTVPSPYGIDRILAADSLVARVLVDTFADHLPLHRQARRMKREGLDISTMSLSRWVLLAGRLLKPVALAVQKHVLANDDIQGDDTGFPVQEGGNGKLRKGRLLAYTDQEQVFYAFTDTKEGRFPVETLQGFQGSCLVADGGSEFNAVVSTLDLERAGCWSHLGTYFFKALPHHPKEAGLAFDTLRDLFLLERRFKDLSPEERLAARQEHIKPLVDGLFEWMRVVGQYARPKSKLLSAITYAMNQEAALGMCLKRGDIPIHNNLSEWMLRQPVVGRKTGCSPARRAERRSRRPCSRWCRVVGCKGSIRTRTSRTCWVGCRIIRPVGLRSSHHEDGFEG